MKIAYIILQVSKFMDTENFATDMDWMPGTKGVNDLFAIGFADGSFKLITKLAKVEKTVTDAHKGAVITLLLPRFIYYLTQLTSLKWSNDGSTLATAGEDGQLRVKPHNIET